MRILYLLCVNWNIEINLENIKLKNSSKDNVAASGVWEQVDIFLSKYSYISKYLVNTLELNEKFLPVLASIARPPRRRVEKFDKWPRPQLKLSNLTLVTSVRSPQWRMNVNNLFITSGLSIKCCSHSKRLLSCATNILFMTNAGERLKGWIWFPWMTDCSDNAFALFSLFQIKSAPQTVLYADKLNGRNGCG